MQKFIFLTILTIGLSGCAMTEQIACETWQANCEKQCATAENNDREGYDTTASCREQCRAQQGERCNLK
ncbi:MAG: hypothetical protein ACWA5L_06845 [bacterium]